jgi:hypothetical protein
MTPKEKAEELVNKFTQTNGNSFFAKECALIAVDEIINSNPNNPLFSDKKTENGYTDMTPIDYWQQVKKEVEKL